MTDVTREMTESGLVADPKAEAGIGNGVVGGFGSTSQQVAKVSLLAEGQQYWPRWRS